MKIKVHLSIGFYGADHKDVLDIPDEDLEGLTDDEKYDLLYRETEKWANKYIEFHFEEEKDGDEE